MKDLRAGRRGDEDRRIAAGEQDRPGRGKAEDAGPGQRLLHEPAAGEEIGAQDEVIPAEAAGRERARVLADPRGDRPGRAQCRAPADRAGLCVDAPEGDARAVARLLAEDREPPGHLGRGDGGADAPERPDAAELARLGVQLEPPGAPAGHPELALRSRQAERRPARLRLGRDRGDRLQWVLGVVEPDRVGVDLAAVTHRPDHRADRRRHAPRPPGDGQRLPELEPDARLVKDEDAPLAVGQRRVLGHDQEPADLAGACTRSSWVSWPRYSTARHASGSRPRDYRTGKSSSPST